VTKPVHMYVCYQIHLSNFVITYATQRTEILVKEHKTYFKLHSWDCYPALRHTAVQSSKLQFFWSITYFNGEWLRKPMNHVLKF